MVGTTLVYYSLDSIVLCVWGLILCLRVPLTPSSLKKISKKNVLEASLAARP